MRPLDQDTTLDAGIAMHRSSWLSAEIILVSRAIL
jgi:hypothetical protein